MVFYFTKVRTNTEKIAWVIILTNLINRGEDMQTTLLNTKQEKSIEFRLKQHNKGKIREVNHFFRQNAMKKVLNNNEIKR